MFDIISIGSATRDGFFKGIPFVEVEDKRFSVGRGIALPYGGKVKVPEVIFSTGGGATNVSVTFSRQGFKTCCICRIGKDVSGEEIIRNLKAEKVNTKYFQIDKNSPSAYSVIFLTESGERTILSYKGAGDDISEKEIPWKKLKSRWLFLSSLAGNKELLIESINWAKKKKAFLATNPGFGELKIFKEFPELLNNFDIFILNQEEAATLTDIPYNQEKELFKKLDNLIQGLVVMTKGPEGLIVSNGKELWRVGTYKEKAIVDRTGAGDAFASGFVSAFLGNKRIIKKDGRCIFEDKNIEMAIRLGSANATSKVEKISAKAGLLRRGDINEERWLELKVIKEIL